MNNQVLDASPESAAQSGQNRFVWANIRGVCWLALVLGSVFWIVPQFRELYEELELDLPAFTEMTIWVANWCRNRVLAIVPILAAIVFTLENSLANVPAARFRKVLTRLDWALMLCFVLVLGTALVGPCIF